MPAFAWRSVKSRRWLEIHLVVERSATMRFWQHTAVALRKTLQRATGASAVKLLFLEFRDGMTVLLSEGNQQVSNCSFITSHSDQCVFVLSDAIGFGWQTYSRSPACCRHG